MKFLSLVLPQLILLVWHAEASSLRGLQGSIGSSFGGETDNPTCTTDSDCPTIYCFRAPCDKYICVENTCTFERDRFDNPPDEGYDNTEIDVNATTPCKEDSDCPVAQCIREPCDTFFCIQGKCTLVLDRTPNGEESDIIDVDNKPFFIDVEDNPITIEVPWATTAEECGNVTCEDGEFCCNKSCGICAKVGGACTEQYCGDFFDFDQGTTSGGEECGPVTCDVGEVCCNRSCGVCTKPGVGCTKEFCGEIPDEEEEELEDMEPVSFIAISRGDCECPEQCSVCKRLLGMCIRMYCFD